MTTATQTASALAPVAESRLIVIDDAMADPEAYREVALHQPFESITFGDVTFHGIGTRADGRLGAVIHRTYPQAVTELTFFRKSPRGQQEPNFVHTDRDMGDWTGILYLTPKPADGDGTTFWRHKVTGAHVSTADGIVEATAEYEAWRDMSQWEPWTTIEAKMNRLVLFSSSLFHSRALRHNYGRGDNARLIQCIFGSGDLS